MKISKRTEDRIKSNLSKFQKVFAVAKARDLNESDTVSIITDMLSEVFGYDKYLEVTSELAIRGTYCDLAVKIGEKFEYLIECKAIGIDLKENHLRQAVGYGANKGIQWIVLTNGLEWNVYRLRFEQPIQWDLVAKFSLETINIKNDRDMERLTILTKEGVEKGAREELYEKIQCVNKYVVGQLLLADPAVSLLRRELRKLADGINVEDAEVIAMLRDNVIRRDLLDDESEDVQSAASKVNKFYKQSAKKAAAPKPKPEAPKQVLAPAQSLSDQLLAEANSQPAPAADAPQA